MLPCCPARPDDDRDVPHVRPSSYIRGARVIDGTGAPWFPSDIRIRAGRIADIGPSLPADGAAVVDAGGRYLAPGFIDAHCHDDLICLREPDRIEKAMQGVTTLVVGNCRFSLYPPGPGPPSCSASISRPCWARRSGEEVFDSFAAIALPCMNEASPSTSSRWWGTPPCGCPCWAMIVVRRRRRDVQDAGTARAPAA